MAQRPQSKKPAAKRPPEAKLAGGDLVLDVKDLKSAFGDRLDIACLRTEIVQGETGASLMIPSNEPCPVNPHNHDGVASARFFQKVLVIKF